MSHGHLHHFTLDLRGWRPATPEDALAIGHDLILHGTAFATDDGRRVDPDTVQVWGGEAWGGRVGPGARPARPGPLSRLAGTLGRLRGGRGGRGALSASERPPWPFVASRSRRRSRRGR